MLPCSCPAPGTQCGRFCTYLLISLSVYADAGFNSCPYCWKTCRAVSADACMGLKQQLGQHLKIFSRSLTARKAGSSQQQRSSAACSRFLLLMPQRQKPQPAATSRLLHSRVASALRRVQYDVAGVAAAICRHEHVLAWCDLQGPENFSYYDALVERCMMLLGGRGLAIFFVDIACRYAGWFEK